MDVELGPDDEDEEGGGGQLTHPTHQEGQQHPLVEQVAAPREAQGPHREDEHCRDGDEPAIYKLPFSVVQKVLLNHVSNFDPHLPFFHHQFPEMMEMEMNMQFTNYISSFITISRKKFREYIWTIGPCSLFRPPLPIFIIISVKLFKSYRTSKFK